MERPSSAVDPRRVEEAGLNAVSTPRQLFYDGWLLRLSPGKARRARSVNAHFGSTLPLRGKIAHCARVYEAHGLPLLFRVTPFVQPTALPEALAAEGFAPHDETLVQVAPLDAPPDGIDGVAAIGPVQAGEWVDAVAALRGSPPLQREAHRERIANSPLDARRLVARVDGEIVAAGQVVLEDGLAGVFDVVTAPRLRGRGVGRALVAALLAQAWERGARAAYLQVDAGNAPALAVYRRFGFATSYTYDYWAPPGGFA